MPAYSVTCPECRTSLKSPRPIAAGTPLECPKCQVMFAAPKARPAPRPEPSVQPRHRDEVIDDVEVIDDDVEVIDDVEVVDDDAPPRRRNGPPVRRKPVNRGVEVIDDDEDDDEDDEPRRFKPKRKPGSNKGLVIAICAIAAVVVLGGAGLGFYYLIMGVSADDPLAYVPAESQFVVGVDAAALLNSQYGPKIEGMFNNPLMEPLTKYKQETKASNRDIFQRVVLAGRADGSGPIFVIRSAVPWEAAKLGEALNNTAKSLLGGATIYRKAGNATGGVSVVGVPQKKVAVFGNLPDAQLEPVLKGKAALSGDMATLVDKASKGTIYVAYVLDANTRQQASSTFAVLGPSAKWMESAVQAAKGATIWVTLGKSEVEFKVGILMSDAGAAQKLAADMQSAKKLGAANKPTPTGVPLPQTVNALAQELDDNSQVAADGTMTIVTMKAKTGTLDAVISEMSSLVEKLGAAGVQPPTPTPPAGQPNRGGRGGRGGGRP